MTASYGRSRFTAKRWAALRWIRDHERDINSVSMQKQPSRRMLGIMLKEEQIVWKPTNMVRQYALALSDKGQRDLDSKHRHVYRKAANAFGYHGYTRQRRRAGVDAGRNKADDQAV